MIARKNSLANAMRPSAVAVAGLMALAAPSWAQTVVDSYVAEIAPQDRVNSRGTALSDPGAILAQDRANYHRFGIRQAGDSGDGVFADRSMRAAIPEMVARGEIAPDARAAILGGGSVQVQVEFLRGAGGDSIRVRLAAPEPPAQVADAPTTVVAPAVPAPAAPAAPAFGLAPSGAAAPAAGWAMEQDPSGMRGIASVRTAAGARVALECTRQGADAAAFAGPGVLLPYQEGALNLLVETVAFPSLAADAAGQQVTVALAIDGQPIGATAMAALPEARALGTSIPSTHPVFAQLAAGTALTLREDSTGAQALVPLSGLGAALDALGPVCARPAGQPAPGAALPQLGTAPAATAPAAPPQAAAAPATPPVAPPQTVSAPPTSTPDASTLRGNDAVAQQLALWLIGQRPALIEDQTSLFALANATLPAGYPTWDLSRRADPTYLPELRAALVARTAQERVPGTVQIDVPVQLSRPDATLPFTMRSPTFLNDGWEGLDAAVRLLHLELPFRLGRVVLRETDPLPLQLPEALARMQAIDNQGRPAIHAFQSLESTLLRVTLALSDPRVLLPVDRTRVRGTPAEIAATVQSVALIKETYNRDGPNPETVLATWDRGAGGAAPRPVAPAFAQRIALGTEDGRLSAASESYRQAMGLPRVIPSTGRGVSAAAEAAALLIQTSAILSRYPDRPLSEDALFELLTKAVDPLARDRIVPVGFGRTASDSNMNEIQFAQTIAGAEPKVRAYVTANAPTLPIPVRARSLARLGEYDLTTQRLPWEVGERRIGLMGELDMSGLVRSMPDALGIAPAEAGALIEALDQDALPGRSVPILLDYEIASSFARPGRSGEITLDEIREAGFGFRFGQATLFADGAEQVALLRHVFPEPETRPEAERVPEAIYETTPEAIWATWARVRGAEDELMRNYVMGRQDFSRRSLNMSESQKAALAESEAARIAALAKDRFWIGLSFQPGVYDPAKGTLAISSVAVQPFVYPVSGREANVPEMLFMRELGFDSLTMSPEAYAQFQDLVGTSRSVTALALVGPAAEQPSRRHQLALARPETVLIGDPQGRWLPQRIALRLDIEAPPGLAPDASPSAPTPPERLLLDGEGLDLLALSRDPDLYGEAAFRRMLVERLARERQAVRAGEALPWGTFFADPGIALRPGMIDAVLPAFTEWTRARAAVLPGTVVVPFGVNGTTHPTTQCRRAQRLPDQGAFATRAVVTGVGGLAPGFDAGQQPPPILDQVARPGAAGAFVLAGRAAHPDPFCANQPFANRRGDLSPDATGIDYGAAGYVDALVLAEYPVVPRAEGARIEALDYVVAVEDIRLERLAPGAGDQPGLRGVLVVSGKVTAVDTFVWDSRTRTYPPGETIEAEAWLSVLPDDNAPLPDILGLTLGVPLADLEALVAERIDGAIRHVSPPLAERRVYGEAVGFSAPDRSEVFLSIVDAADEAKPAIALMRYRYFEPGTVRRDAVSASLVEKYGEPDATDGDTLMWGVPPRGADRYGVCGGQRTFRGNDAARMQAELPDDEERRLRSEGSYLPPEWGYYGWPIPYANIPAQYVEPARPFCGPAVLARVRTDAYEPGSVDLTVWLLDTKAAEERAAAAPEPEAAKIEL